MELILKGPNEDELHCEITDVLDKYIKSKARWMKSYITPYQENLLLLRVPGATRGNIELEGNKIKTINLYEDISFGIVGCFDKKSKEKLKEELDRFIGSTFK